MKLLLVGFLSLMTAPVASAALIITVGSANIQPGTTGSVDVYIRSDTGTDSLDIANLTFQITQVAGPSANPTLSFVNPQSDSHLADPGYLFAGDSIAILLGPPASTISTTALLNDTYTGGDGTLSGLGILVPMTNTLLARLDLIAGPGIGGSTYTIGLVFPDSSLSDSGLNELSFTSASGTVTTPEPATIAMVGAIGLIGLAARRRNRDTMMS